MMPDQSIDSLNICEQNNCKSPKTLKASSKTADNGIGEHQKVFSCNLNEQNAIDATTANGFEFFTRFAYCQALLYKAWVEASDELANKVPKSINHHTNSKEATSLYIDTFEETFTNLFRSPQFVSNLGKLLNSLMEHIKTNNDVSEIFLNNLSKMQEKLETDKNSKNDRKIEVEGINLDSKCEDDQIRRDISMQIQHQMLDLYMGFVRVLPVLSSLQETEYKTTPYDVIYEEEQVKLLHYAQLAKRLHRTPILIVYALVNRHYILDIETKSAIRNLLNQGFNVYLIDWGTPGSRERILSIDDYVNGFIDRCVDVVRNQSNSDKVSLFGYCMGGTFSTIYTALHKEKVRNLITMAPSIDCSKDTTVFASLARFLDIDNFVDTLGNIPPAFQYLFFMMLKPFKHYVEKYNQVAEKIEDEEFVDDFTKLEKWLWDTPPIPGEVFRQWVKDIYQENLLVQNRLLIGGKLIDLRKIDVPLLNIIAESDHLVSPESSKALNYAVRSKDKTLMSFPTGHVSLCASSYSQLKVWPKVGEWLMERSD